MTIDITIESLPKNILENNIFNRLNHQSVSSFSRTNHFFYNLTDKVRKNNYAHKVYQDLASHSSNFSLEKIEDDINFLVRYASIEVVASILIEIIQNVEEKIKVIRSSLPEYILHTFGAANQDDIKKKYEFQKSRLEYLENFYIEKFGLYGQIFRLINAVENNPQNKFKYGNILTLLYLIKYSSLNSTLSEDFAKIIELVNHYNKEIIDFYKKFNSYTNENLFLGKSDLLLTVNEKTGEVFVCGKPIDEMIKAISENALPDEMAHNFKSDFIKQVRFVGNEIDSNLVDTNQIKNLPQFAEEFNQEKLNSENTAKNIIEKISAFISRSEPEKNLHHYKI